MASDKIDNRMLVRLLFLEARSILLFVSFSEITYTAFSPFLAISLLSLPINQRLGGNKKPKEKSKTQLMQGGFPSFQRLDPLVLANFASCVVDRKPASKSTSVVWEATAPVPNRERCSHAMPIVFRLFLRQFQMGREKRVPERLP